MAGTPAKVPRRCPRVFSNSRPKRIRSGRGARVKIPSRRRNIRASSPLRMRVSRQGRKPRAARRAPRVRPKPSTGSLAHSGGLQGRFAFGSVESFGGLRAPGDTIATHLWADACQRGLSFFGMLMTPGRRIGLCGDATRAPTQGSRPKGRRRGGRRIPPRRRFTRDRDLLLCLLPPFGSDRKR
jgi:hypothetical protein